MESFVTAINKLQEVATLVGPEVLQLPQIVVVGDQSSGKSSLLERVVGKSFLPRGMGVVTRCPIILQLIRRNSNEIHPYPCDYGLFLHNDIPLSNFDEIRSEIVAVMEKKAGSNKAITAEPILLKIYSSTISNLTLVDLPGIVKVPVGDQPQDIEDLVKTLILKYISNPNSIILAVVTANTDMATCESLKLAREVDPDGLRTLAVVTKLDLMDAGTDASDILNGNVIPVKLGIIGTVNRSQMHIDSGKTVNESLKDETAFLRAVYPKIANKHGTFYLCRRLHALLLEHIEQCLPELKDRVNSSIVFYKNLLKSLGEEILDVNKELLQILSRVSTAYCSSISGTHKELETQQLSGGARISYIFHETFFRALENMDPLSGFSRSAIITAMRNSAGAKPALFIPETCFEHLVKKQIQRFEAPSLKCVQLIYEELERILHNCGPEIEQEMVRFPKLFERIILHFRELLKSRLTITNEMVQKIIAIQFAYINTLHPDFIKDKANVTANMRGSYGDGCLQDRNSRSILQLEGPNRPRTSEDVPSGCFIIENLITSYFNIVRKIIQDSVPKTIMCFLVNYVMEKLLSELISKLYSNGVPYGILEESEETIQKRKEISALLSAHEKASTVIEELKGKNY